MTTGEMRDAVLARDEYMCRAPLIDPKAGLCHDRWGQTGAGLIGLEADYIRFRARGKRHELPEDHVALCPGHHRGTGAQQGYIWATAHRAELRAYLDSFTEAAA